MTGQTISHYHVLDKLGEGGMGVVYKAEDVKLGRMVALKFLRAEGLSDDERKGRFLHEARAAAALDHPNICTVYEIDEVDGRLFMAMPFLAGRTLDQRIDEGPLPIHEAVEIALQLADALGEAHAKGIVHRDVKPSNVMLLEREDKPVQVKLMDFGLARLSEATRLTREGVQPGTVQYMSPEQISGEKIDHRTDIWSLGVVLYEMIAGRPPFDGAYEQALYYGILNEAPEPLTGLRTGVPVTLEQTVEKCLDKSPVRRYQTAAELSVDLRRTNPTSTLGRNVHVSLPANQFSRSTARARSQAWPFVAATLAAALAAFAVWPLNHPVPPIAPTVHAEIPVPDNLRLASFYRKGIALSPDGSRLAIVAGQAGPASWDLPSSRLYLRRLGQPEAKPLGGAEGAFSPVFSPDGRWIAFTQDRFIKKTPVDGGALTTICEIQTQDRALSESLGEHVYGMDWGPDDSIVFSTGAGPLFSVPASGGEPVVVSTLDEASHEVGHFSPTFLPGGKWVLFTSVRYAFGRSVRWERAAVAALSLDNGEHRLIIENATAPRYSSSGHLLFAREGRLFAAPFDLDRVEAVGAPTPVVQGVSHSVHTDFAVTETGAAQYDVSDTGLLVYAPGGASTCLELKSTAVWLDQEGAEEPVGLETRLVRAVSPAGEHILFGESMDLWLYDLDRRVRRRQTADGNVHWGIWGPGPDEFTFDSDKSGPSRLYVKSIGAPIDEARELEMDLEGALPRASSWSPDGSKLAFVVIRQDSGADILILDSSGAVRPILDSRFDERYPVFSPNGKWLAYVSDESGRWEVYVTPYPGVLRPVQVSLNGGIEPVWSRTGNELFFRQPKKGEVFLAANVSVDGDKVRVGRPRQLFEGQYDVGNPVAGYDAAPDSRFLAMKSPTPEMWERVAEADFPSTLYVVTNWFEGLQEAASRKD